MMLDLPGNCEANRGINLAASLFAAGSPAVEDKVPGTLLPLKTALDTYSFWSVLTQRVMYILCIIILGDVQDVLKTTPGVFMYPAF